MSLENWRHNQTCNQKKIRLVRLDSTILELEKRLENIKKEATNIKEWLINNSKRSLK